MKKIKSIGILFLVIILGTQTFAQKNYPLPPAPIFSDLLLRTILYEDGRFKPPEAYGYFFSDDKGKLKVIHEGNEIAEYDWRASPAFPPKYVIDGFDITKGKNNALGLYLKKAGNYELHFQNSDGSTFYIFPFKVSASGGDDPYNPQKKLRREGAWNDYAYLYKTTKNEQARWDFRVWVRSKDSKMRQAKSYLRLYRDSDNQLVAIGNSNFRLEGDWKRQYLELKKPGKKNAKGEYYDNRTIYAKDKLQDGGYSLKFYIDENLYGTYKFQVKGGEIQHQDRQVRSSTDPKNYIEGGKREFWLKRQ